MNERKMNLGKIAMVGGMMAITAMLSAIMMTGCGCQQRTEKTVSTADSAATADSAPNTTYSAEEQAVLDEMPESFQQESCYVNGDGRITISDVTEIQRYLAGFDNIYHIGEIIFYDEYELPFIPE